MAETTEKRALLSFTQLDQYLRCPLKYRFIYVDRVDPEFVPASLIFGRGIHAAAAHYFRGIAAWARPTLGDVQGVFESYWDLETSPRAVRFWKGSKAELLDQAVKMLAVFHAAQDPATEVVGVEERFTVPLIDQATGEILDPELVVVLDLLERDREGLVVADLKTARKYTDRVERAPVARAADSTILERCFGPGWIAIGDAAVSYDPLASRGLVGALSSGLEASSLVAAPEGRLADWQAGLEASFATYRAERARLQA